SLNQAERAALAPYFSSTLLDLATSTSGAVDNPTFYEVLRARGITDLIDFRDMLGVTFVDTVVLSPSGQSLLGRERLALLVHELAHVEQYRRLGVEKFARNY